LKNGVKEVPGGVKGVFFVVEAKCKQVSHVPTKLISIYGNLCFKCPFSALTTKNEQFTPPQVQFTPFLNMMLDSSIV